jgi:hypothetical protein
MVEWPEKLEEPQGPALPSPAQVPQTETRFEKLRRQEVLACEDPICCCEAEPRWLRLESQEQRAVSEWESLSRPPREEL